VSRIRSIVVAAVLVALSSSCSTLVAGTPSPAANSASDIGAAPQDADTGQSAASGAPSAPALPSAAPDGSLEATPWPPATIPEAERADVEVIDQGFTAYDVEYTGKVISYAIKVRNPNPNSWVASSVRMDAKFTDDAGTLIFEDDFAVIYTIPPDAVAAAGGTAIGGELRETTAQPTKMTVEVTDISWFSTDDVAPGTLVMGPATVRPGTRDSASDSVVVSCDAHSSYRSELNSGSIAIVFLDATGEIIGGNSDNTTIDNDFISIPGESVTPLEMELLFSLPDGVPAAECYPSFVGPI
jgi:hypothetical protein